MSVLFIQNLSVYQSFIMLFVILTKQKQSLKKKHNWSYLNNHYELDMGKYRSP